MNNLNRYTLFIQNISDILVLILSFVFSVCMKFYTPFFEGTGFSSEAYTRLFLIMVVGYIFISVFILNKDNFLNRDFSEELVSSTKLSVMILIVLLFYAVFSKTSVLYSREFYIIFFFTSIIVNLIVRSIIKVKVLPAYKNGKQSKKMLLIGPKRNVEEYIEKLSQTDDWRFKLTGLIVTDQDCKGQYIANQKVVSNKDEMIADVATGEYDIIYLVPDYIDDFVSESVKQFCDVGKTTYVNVREIDSLSSYAHVTDEIADSTVISYLPVIPIPKRHLAVKRAFDVVLALLLLPLFIVIFVLSFIFSNIESRGPVLHSRIRVSKNGRRFYQYRFRMLRMDAKKRLKAEKTPFTKFGMFLQKTHLDGLPMIMNVLSGDMSFVGPHSPTFSSYVDYHPERRKNLCVDAGVVGYWTYLKSKKKIINYERDYIEHWSILKDFTVLYNVIFRYITFKSPKKYTMIRFNEELKFVQDINAFNKPLKYDRSLYRPKLTVGELIYLFIKRVVDIVLSLVAIIILSPVFLILMILITADDGGSPFYGHERIGKNGKRILVYKFRSMKKDVGDLESLLTPAQLEQYKKEFKIDNDPRITKIGNFIRKTSLDELPQLFNILGGSLSIVGPRPIVEKETLIYGDDIGKLLSVKPGLTGYWQAYARNNATYESGERQQMEMYYVDHHGILLDIKIVFKTFFSVLQKEGAQ